MSSNPFKNPRQCQEIPNPSSATLCRICNKPVPLEIAKADGDGKAIHEECYAQKLRLEKASNAGQDGKTDGAATRPWKVIAAQVAQEQDPKKITELVAELNKALREQNS
jgi:hypothetical protein